MPKALKTVIAGAGGMGGVWSRVVAECPGTRCVGLVDIDPTAPERLLKRLGIGGVETGGDLAAMLKRLRPDLVIDCTVPEAHREVTLTALRHGCHVIGEKPLADSMTAARQMVKAAERAGRIYMVSQNRRFEPRIQAIVKAIAAGRIGALVSIDADFYMGVHFGGFREAMDHPLLIDMAIHHFDMARFIGGIDAEAVYAKAYRPKGSWYAGEAAALAVFEMSGGAVFGYRGSWSAIFPATSWNAQWRILGEKGCILWDGEGAPMLYRQTDPKAWQVQCTGRALPLRAMKHTGQAEALREFLRALTSTRHPNGWCGDNIRSLAMVYAAVASAGSGRRTCVGV